jgi:tRNA/tmRNA/rRNA uracil-C5-methylase (TrmA/RlmC/RlmD family)
MTTPGARLTLTIEKPAAGGRMIARHEGAVVLVSGAIPGEVVEAVVEKTQRTLIWARTDRVVDVSMDRVAVQDDWTCGGSVFAHIKYVRQLSIKRDIVHDAFARIGRLPLPGALDVMESPRAGYRMRARLHVVGHRVGFFREGTHELCDAAASRQLLPNTIETLRRLEAGLAGAVGNAIDEVELAENCGADQRALHLRLHANADPSRLASVPVLDDVRGISYGFEASSRAVGLRGEPEVSDTITLPGQDGVKSMTLTRQAHAFFQGNRHLLAPLIHAVVEQVPDGRVLDLYAGVGLFSVALAITGRRTVVAVEGDRVSAHDLKRNAGQAAGLIEARHQPVEHFLIGGRAPAVDTVLLDPPRTGATKEALHGVLALGAERIVYVSCDVATLARDARALADNGYALIAIRAFDMFPNTAHIECLAVFQRGVRLEH